MGNNAHILISIKMNNHWKKLAHELLNSPFLCVIESNQDE